MKIEKEEQGEVTEKYFTQHKVNVSPMARSDAEWRGIDMELPLEGYKYKVRACAKCRWGEKVGDQSELMGYVYLPLLCCPACKN